MTEDSLSFRFSDEHLAAMAGDGHDVVLKEIIPALRKISPDLVPVIEENPFSTFILRQNDGLKPLFKLAAEEEAPEKRARILEGVGEIFKRNHAPAWALDKVRAIIESSESLDISSVAARLLALGHDGDFLAQQHEALKGDSIRDKRIASTLIGYGNYRPAIPELIKILNGGEASLRDVSIEALAKMKSVEAIPALIVLLDSGDDTHLVLDALGRIGDASVAMLVLNQMKDGIDSQRKIAARALSRILRNNGESTGDAGHDTQLLAELPMLMERDPDLGARFYALVCYATLGGTLSKKKILQVLDARISGDELSSIAKFFVKGDS